MTDRERETEQAIEYWQKRHAEQAFKTGFRAGAKYVCEHLNEEQVGMLADAEWDGVTSNLSSAPSPAGETCWSCNEPIESCGKTGWLHVYGLDDHYDHEAHPVGKQSNDVSVPEPVSTEGAMSETAKAFASIEAARRMARGHMELSKTLVAAPIAPADQPDVFRWCQNCRARQVFYRRNGKQYCDNCESEVVAPAAEEIYGNETKPVADLLNSMKVIDRSQRYMECRADLLTQYMYELVRLRAKPSAEGDGWIAVTDDMPKFGEDVLTYTPPQPKWNHGATRRVSRITVYSGKKEMVWFDGDINQWITHWRPLPAPPSGQGEKE